MCSFNGLVLSAGAVVVLGPRPGLPRNFDEQSTPEHKGHTPQHMQISRQKLRPGSGCLAVKVLMEGPIRVLQINDIQRTVSNISFVVVFIKFNTVR